MTIAEEAIAVAAAADARRKFAERQAASVEAEHRRASQEKLLVSAHRWAIPLLNARLGYRRTWKLLNAKPAWNSEPPSVEVQIADYKVLRVTQAGSIKGDFKVRAALRFDRGGETYRTEEIRDLEHLGHLLAKERECNDYEMRNAD